jgi:hypothetical protein
MKVFVDESGTFSGFHPLSIGAVGALAVPDQRLSFIERKYEGIRRRLPRLNGEVKGKLLNEQQVAEVVRLLARNEAIFEVTVIDLGMHTEAGVSAYKRALFEGMHKRLPLFNVETKPQVEALLRELAATPLNLFLQTVALFETLHRIIHHVPLYFVQRRPAELASFSWVIDGKDPSKVTSWEKWWASYAIGALATKSTFRPSGRLEGADYSYYDRYRSADEKGEGIDLGLLMRNLRFSSTIEFGLEWVDVLTNAVRRALIGNLEIKGWDGIVGTMIHRKQHYLEFVQLDEARARDANSSYAVVHPPYARVVNHFRSGGRPMLTKHMLRMAVEESREASRRAARPSQESGIVNKATASTPAPACAPPTPCRRAAPGRKSGPRRARRASRP